MTISQSQSYIASNPRFALTRQSRPKIQEGQQEEGRSASPYRHEIGADAGGNGERPRPDSCDPKPWELAVAEEKFQPGRIVATPGALGDQNVAAQSSV
jgi:hypothetical protein